MREETRDRVVVRPFIDDVVAGETRARPHAQRDFRRRARKATQTLWLNGTREERNVADVVPVQPPDAGGQTAAVRKTVEHVDAASRRDIHPGRREAHEHATTA